MYTYAQKNFDLQLQVQELDAALTTATKARTSLQSQADEQLQASERKRLALQSELEELVARLDAVYTRTTRATIAELYLVS